MFQFPQAPERFPERFAQFPLKELALPGHFRAGPPARNRDVLGRAGSPAQLSSFSPINTLISLGFGFPPPCPACLRTWAIRKPRTPVWPLR